VRSNPKRAAARDDRGLNGCNLLEDVCEVGRTEVPIGEEHVLPERGKVHAATVLSTSLQGTDGHDHRDLRRHRRSWSYTGGRVRVQERTRRSVEWGVSDTVHAAARAEVLQDGSATGAKTRADVELREDRVECGDGR